MVKKKVTLINKEMKKINTSLVVAFFFLFSLQIRAQINISDKSKDPEIKAIKYDGSFMDLSNVYSKEKKAGLVGEKITLLEIWNLIKESGQEVGFSERKNFENKTFEIIDYSYGLGDVLKIKSKEGVFIFKPSIMDKYVFNKYIKTVNEKVINKIFIPLKMKSDAVAMNGEKILINGSKDYKVTKVSFSKLKIGYGLVLELNYEFEMVYPNGSYDQFDKLGWINIQSSSVLQSNITLLEKSTFDQFANTNKEYLSEIRNSKVKLGMTKEQCDFSWGSATKVLNNVSGYQVRIYGKIGNSQSLYFKNGILKLIK